MSLLSRLISERNQKKKELETYRNRKSQTDKILKSVNGSFDDGISDSISNNERSNNSIGAGVKGDISSISTVRGNIDSLKEKYIWSDRSMSEVASNLESEAYRCQIEIDRLESEIRSLDREIEAEREAERERKRKAAEKEG